MHKVLSGEGGVGDGNGNKEKNEYMREWMISLRQRTNIVCGTVAVYEQSRERVHY